jgi:hypothetical protein
MNDQDLERDVSRVLHEMFPEPTEATLRVPESAPRRGSRIAAIAASIVAVAAIGLTVALAATTTSNGGSGHRAGGSGHQTGPMASPSTPPAWTEKCLPTRSEDRLGPAPEYVGLTMGEALDLAKRQPPDSLVIVGAGGNCNSMSDLVARARPVAVVFDKANSFTDARIVAAERVSTSWAPGT